MNLKNKTISILILGIISLGFLSCSDDNPIEEQPVEYAELSDVTLA